jgi:hypothetical protein
MFITMNKPLMKRSFTFFVLLLLVIGCKKDPFDNRSKYLGDYTFSITKTTAMSTDNFVDTTYSYLGTIKSGSDNNSVIIHFSDNLYAVMDLYEDGSLEKYFDGGYLVGEFESAEKVKFVYSLSGGGIRYGVKGDKK